MRTVEITLNGEKHTVQELRSRANREWRAKLEAHFSELADALENAPDTDLTDGSALAGLVRSVSGKLLRSVDILTELLVAYAPDLKPIIDDAYDSEILEAFTQVLGLAYPFGPMVNRLKAIGSQLAQTTQS